MSLRRMQTAERALSIVKQSFKKALQKSLLKQYLRSVVSGTDVPCPAQAVRFAIRGMLPKNKLRDRIMSQRLEVRAMHLS